MIRLSAAALLLILTAMPAFACEYNQSASTDTQSRTATSQPANGHATQGTKHSQS